MPSGKTNQKKTRTKSNKVMTQTRGGLGGLEGPDPTLGNGQTPRFGTSRNKVTTALLALQPSPLLAHARPEGQGSPGWKRVPPVPQPSWGAGQRSAARGASHTSRHGGAATDFCLPAGQPRSQPVVAGCLADFVFILQGFLSYKKF